MDFRVVLDDSHSTENLSRSTTGQFVSLRPDTDVVTPYSSVLPAAIERDVLIAFSSTKSDSATEYRSTHVFLRNLDKRYEAIEFDVDLRGGGKDVILSKGHHWSDYFKAGIKVCRSSLRFRRCRISQ